MTIPVKIALMVMLEIAGILAFVYITTGRYTRFLWLQRKVANIKVRHSKPTVVDGSEDGLIQIISTLKYSERDRRNVEAFRFQCVCGMVSDWNTREYQVKAQALSHRCAEYNVYGKERWVSNPLPLPSTDTDKTNRKGK